MISYYSTVYDEFVDLDQGIEEGSNDGSGTPVYDFPQEVADDLAAIRQILEEQQSEEEVEEVTEAEEEVSTEETSEDPLQLVFSDPCDHNLYLSSEVSGYVTNNDMYSLLLSIRNILLLFFLCFVVFRMLSMLRGVLYKLMNK